MELNFFQEILILTFVLPDIGTEIAAIEKIRKKRLRRKKNYSKISE
jgi:hypothetical protein